MRYTSRVCRDAVYASDHAACTGCEGCLCHGVTEPQAGFPTLFAEARARARAASQHYRQVEEQRVAAAHRETERLTA